MQRCVSIAPTFHSKPVVRLPANEIANLSPFFKATGLPLSCLVNVIVVLLASHVGAVVAEAAVAVADGLGRAQASAAMINMTITKFGTRYLVFMMISFHKCIWKNCTRNFEFVV